MRRYYKYILIFLIVIHSYFLFVYGISTFISTVLLYYCIYWLLVKIVSLFKSEKWKITILKNIKYTFSIMIIIEFILYFIFVFSFQTGVRKIVYFSGLKQKKQIELLSKLNLRNLTVPTTDAYVPNSKRLISVKNYTYSHSYNELGFRGKLPFITKDSNEYRIVILGDSFIEGDGTSEDSTISVLLEKKLNATIPNYKFNVINGGISGSNPIYEMNLYRKLLSNYNPNLIILSVFNNDLSDIKTMESLSDININESICNISALYRFVYYVFYSFDNYQYPHASKKILKQREKIIHELADSIENFKIEVASKNTQLITMYIPTQNEVRSSEYNSKIGEHIYYDVNLFNIFKKTVVDKEKFANNYYWQNDAHFKPKGYNLVAEILAKKIKHDVRTN